MRKVLLTVMMVSSLLAFNACKKDGAQGPAGPAGPQGPAGAAGAVGPAGAKGADGTKILPTTGAPAATLGAQGDYAFDSATKTLYGPKTATAWPAGISLSGANGATGATGATGAVGATGANGTKFLAGAGAPTNADGSTGDYWFDTNTSTFYGPKLADGTWGTNVMPLGSSFSAKTYTITRGFENVTQVTKTFGEVAKVTYKNFDIITTYEINADDALRIANYPGWSDNREMIFETVNGSGVFDAVPQSAADFGTDPFVVGRRFMYTGNTANPTTTFNLTATDIARLTSNAGAAFGYLTYAKATTGDSNPANSYTPTNPNELTTGKTLNFARVKDVNVSQETSGANYNATYTAQTKFNLNTLVPNYEKYKQDGKVFVKYRYYTNNTTGNNPVIHTGANAGWIDLTTYANSYVLGTGGYGTAGVTDANPFTLGAAVNFMGSASPFGVAGTAVTVGADQVATATTILTGANATTFDKGNIVINWNINSGTNLAGTATSTPFGPTTYAGTTINVPTGARPAAVNRAFETAFYSVPQLTSNVAITGTGNINVISRTNGKDAAYFTSTKLVQVQVFVIPGDVIKALKAKGVDTNNPNAIGANIKL